MIHRTLLPCLLSAVLGASSVIAAPLALQGTWIWDDGRAGVEFHACGEALCGRIIWLKTDVQPGAAPMLDAKNANAALRKRRVFGIDYITEVKPTRDGKWKGGRVYDFNSGSIYDLDIDAIAPTRVTMRGYKGMRMLGATLTPVRPVTPLTHCAPAEN